MDRVSKIILQLFSLLCLLSLFFCCVLVSFSALFLVLLVELRLTQRNQRQHSTDQISIKSDQRNKDNIHKQEQYNNNIQYNKMKQHTNNIATTSSASSSSAAADSASNDILVVSPTSRTPTSAASAHTRLVNRIIADARNITNEEQEQTMIIILILLLQLPLLLKVFLLNCIHFARVHPQLY